MDYNRVKLHKKNLLWFEINRLFESTTVFAHVSKTVMQELFSRSMVEVDYKGTRD